MLPILSKETELEWKFNGQTAKKRGVATGKAGKIFDATSAISGRQNTLVIAAPRALGDTSTLADPAVVDGLIENRQNRTG